MKNVLLQDFISRDTAYGLYINEYWASITTPVPGNGVSITGVTFKVALFIFEQVQSAELMMYRTGTEMSSTGSLARPFL